MTTRRARREKNLLIAAGAVVGLALGISWPFLWVEIGTRSALTCLAQYRKPRDERVGSCNDPVKWFVTPSRIPWTRTAASYRAEELAARVVIGDYLDGVIGHPERAAIGRAGEALDRSDRAMRAGSTRVELTELGPAVSAPNLGYYADRFDDRATLLAKADQWTDWKIRRRTLAFAFQDASPERIASIAKSYAGMDPRDEDLRVAVGAGLCLSGDARLGLEFLALVQDTRANHRYEAMARNFGDVRAAMVACAEKAHVEPPSKPAAPEAGQLDRPEARAVLRLRTLAARGDEATAVEKRDAGAGVLGLLVEGTKPPGARLALVAALLAVGQPIEPTELVALATPKMDESPLIPRLTSPYDWLEERVGVVPVPGTAALRVAVKRVEDLAATPGLEAAARDALLDLRAAFWVELARAHAAMRAPADTTLALQSGRRAFEDDDAFHVALGTGLWVAGQRVGALAELDAVSNSAPTATRKLAAVLRAEVLASLGRRDEAGALAIAADDLEAKDWPELDVRARWTRFALAPKSPLRAGSLTATAIDLARPLSWPSASLHDQQAWVIGADPEALPPLDRALSLWSAARAAAPADRLAARYAVIERGGAAPRARVAYLDAAAQLLPAAEGDVEIWLDAFFALDARALPLRTVAWSRAEAARFRGDSASAAAWDERARRLQTQASADPELAAVLGL